MTIAFVASGDLHLVDTIWRRHRHITGDARQAFSQVIDHAIRLAVPLVLVGDLFDSTDPDSTLVRFVRQELDRLREACQPCFALQGNHDKQKVPWYLACSPWPQHIGDGEMRMIGGLDCRGYDYAVKDVIEQQLRADHDAAKPAPQVLFLHQAVSQALKWEGAWNCDLEWVDPRIPLVVMGDIHTPHCFPLPNGTALYTGSTHPRSVEEIGPKHCLAVHHDLTVEELPIRQRHFEQVVWTETAEVDPAAVLRGIRNAIERQTAPGLPPVCFVRYDASRSAQARALIDALHAENCIAIDDPMLARGEALDAGAVDTSDLPGIPTLLGRILDPVSDRFALQFATDLMDPTSDTPALIRDQRDRFMTGLKPATT